ncbi:bifunctional proline dehydrogenase/L-glutamate gamma-semialdehyde dehydrogenase PutA [Piscirickettsia salmonis]|uniref:bifunctional proline dehydrogenase/L-glutamate gamma-semialdehyde dehydrogenase PutA n=1 Tax=Piscirickettsia salmonis TaxID=1238 RepID=UPI00137BBDF2|nr:bifunctional proline dehydrogenase/L-glutamate gamma-semialdehyde dehydrogenase PutA [Piscirickettsia salmonis]QHS32677.1 bifunctional proline dehydrogenase/L-glutamate gamma-semialdehyde dehydrogenase PutA [Piscirickettsia salmonis]
MLYANQHSKYQPSVLRAAITNAWCMDEQQAINALLHTPLMTEHQIRYTQQQAHQLIEKVRSARLSQGGIDAFMQEYSLSSQEGIALMCLAEALLRIPDTTTSDKLIKDKLSDMNWSAHQGQSDSLFVNSATWGLILTGQILSAESTRTSTISRTLKKLSGRIGEPMIRQATRYAMKLLGEQFVTGQTVEAALKRAKKKENIGYRYSYDMLGEAAKTDTDALFYLSEYKKAIEAIGTQSKDLDIISGPGISIKLSALHPRYEVAQYGRVMDELYPRLYELALLAKKYNLGLNIDAEEANRLELSLDLIEKLCEEPSLAGWNGIGVVIQAYQKRCPYVIDWLIDTAKRTQHRLMIRLVKGAYWDSEIKLAQELGLDGYPVYTRKVYTDLSYLYCAQKLLDAPEQVYPQFATHNAYTLSAILELAGQYRDFEFQCLHGMGETLYDQVVGKNNLNIPCRIYAPVGTYKNLLAYLVRRLLENGANSSFVNQILDENIPISRLIADPIQIVKSLAGKPHAHLPLPRNLYGNQRLNSKSFELNSEKDLDQLNRAMAQFSQKLYHAKPTTTVTTDHLNNNNDQDPPSTAIKNPANHNEIIGHVSEAGAKHIEAALTIATAAFPAWQHTTCDQRATLLEKAADLFEEHMPELMQLAIREAGKTLANAIAEIREAIDFCRYYAKQAREEFTVESGLTGRGPIVCISPWNFPLAIFTGEVAAALAAGNTVLAKPAEQTPLIAARAVELMHQAGISPDVLQLLPGQGETVGAALVQDQRIKGVIFTGSTEVAHSINRTLAQRDEVIPLIAETGGQNAMIVDSSALAEQVVTDVITSGFDSAGQRCSALRVLFLQEDIADHMVTMLKGAMAELTIGNPAQLNVDVGPVIDTEAQTRLNQHIEKTKTQAKLLFQCELPKNNGTFVAPTVFELNNLNDLKQEVFGPIIHIVRFKAGELDQVIEQINATGFGLTLGVHSRISKTINEVIAKAKVGNLYINRNQVGAVVGVQPFGGEGLSGTGPKAGGPLYMHQLVSSQYSQDQQQSENHSTEHTHSSIPTPEPAPTTAVTIDAIKQAISQQTIWQEGNAQRSALLEIALNKARDRKLTPNLDQHQRDLLITQSKVLASKIQQATLLPSPTGEDNTLSNHPLGTLLYLLDQATTVTACLNSISATLASGNSLVVVNIHPTITHINIQAIINCFYDAGVPPAALSFFATHPEEINSVIADHQITIAGLVYSGINPAIYNKQLSLRASAILPFIHITKHSVPLHRLVHERTITINTTAAGGNASLMTMQED